MRKLVMLGYFACEETVLTHVEAQAFQTTVSANQA